MKVLVCGGRDYSDEETLARVLSALRPRSILHGACGAPGPLKGADGLADRWARRFGIPCLPIAADWKRLGKRAGPMRNRSMLGFSPDLVVAFPGGRGTEDMVVAAVEAGVLVLRVEPKRSRQSELFGGGGEQS